MTERMPARRALEGEVIGGTLYPHAGGVQTRTIQAPAPDPDPEPEPDLEIEAAAVARRNRRRDAVNALNLVLCLVAAFGLVALFISHS